MRRLIFALALLSFPLCASAQTGSSTKNEAAVIQHVKNLSASSFDARLPLVSLAYFLAYETEDAPARWTTTRCKEQHSAGESVDAKRNTSNCVQADFDLNNGSALTILIRVEESQSHKFSDSSVVSLSITELTGANRQIRSLGDLPMELHRWPAKAPKDLPAPGRDS